MKIQKRKPKTLNKNKKKDTKKTIDLSLPLR